MTHVEIARKLLVAFDGGDLAAITALVSEIHRSRSGWSVRAESGHGAVETRSPR